MKLYNRINRKSAHCYETNVSTVRNLIRNITYTSSENVIADAEFGRINMFIE